MQELAGIFFSTFIAEDLTAVGTGLLIHQGRVDPFWALLACAAGIWIGDLGLWGLGRATRAAIRRPGPLSLVGRLSRVSRGVDTIALAPRLPIVILTSRLLPGTRLPLYLAAGAIDVPLRQFAFWSLVAVATWTPAVVLLTAGLGPSVAELFTRYLGVGWLPLVLTAIALMAALRAVVSATARIVRGPVVRRCVACLQRAARWEFWPMWLFYAPVALWTFWLALRHGGYATVTAANPGMPDGGVVGESKYDIIRRLPRPWALPSIVLAPGPAIDRLRVLLEGMRRESLTWPMVLKPDVGQRGTGVKLVRSLRDAQAYLTAFSAPVVAQPYHPGPFEAGIFYYRFPGEPRGRILSITDKVFPAVVGDGKATIASLVRSHDRYRMQADTFLTRLGADAVRIPADGERVVLGIAGNHAQGALFRSGRHLITPALVDRVDRIARSYDGFFVGRFDVRYSDVRAFTTGRDLAIVELNGATAESTDIYDPENTLLRAYGRLFRQWSLVFAIGAANRAAGAPVTPPRRLLSLIRTHLATPATFPVAD